MPLSQGSLERLIAHSTDIVCATDRQGRIVYYNDGASKSLGYTQEEILGQFVGKVYPDLAEARRVMQAMRGEGHGGKGIVNAFQTTFKSKSGELIPVAISGTVLYDETGAEDGTVGFAKDLREILRKDQLATLGEVTVGLSHEVNNPLCVIVNQLALLERDIEQLAGERDCSVEYERIDAMRRETSRITEILERLEAMARSEAYETVEYIGPARMIDLRAPRAETKVDPRLAGKRVLVVDDDLGLCRSLAEILEGYGCAVETACDGLEGLRRIESGHFDAVLSDVVMPNLDGYELFKAVHERWPALPVLMMTAFHYDKDHIIKRSRMQGLQGVLFKKPVDPARLRDVLVEVLEKKPSTLVRE
jgi:PAS domain S-box-containing protein